MNGAPFHIVIARKKQFMLSFLKVRAIINGREIYALHTKPIVIPVQYNNPRIVITDGYHITKPLKLVYQDVHVYFFRVACAIDNWKLLAGFATIVILFLSGFITGQLVLKVFSFIPLVYLIFFYYLNRKEFIRLVPVLR